MDVFIACGCDGIRSDSLFCCAFDLSVVAVITAFNLWFINSLRCRKMQNRFEVIIDNGLHSA